ncbi:MAG: hypothetical protein V4494_01915 [Chlamydiota bacterium]
MSGSANGVNNNINNINNAYGSYNPNHSSVDNIIINENNLFSTIVNLHPQNDNKQDISEVKEGRFAKIKKGVSENARAARDKIAAGVNKVKNGIISGGKAAGNGVVGGGKSLGSSLKRNTINVFLPESFIDDETSRSVKDGMGGKQSLQMLKRSEIRHTNASKVADLEKILGLTVSTADLNELLYVKKDIEYTKNEENALKNKIADFLMKNGEVKTRQEGYDKANTFLNAIKYKGTNALNPSQMNIYKFLSQNKRQKHILILMYRSGNHLVSSGELRRRAAEAAYSESKIKKANEFIVNLKKSSDEQIVEENKLRAKKGLKPLTRQSINAIQPLERASFISRAKYTLVNDVRRAWNVGSVVARTPMALAQVPMNAAGLMNSGPEKLVTSVLGVVGLAVKLPIVITALTAIVGARILGKVVKVGLYAAAAIFVAGLAITGVAIGGSILLAGPTVGKIYDKSLDKSTVENFYKDLKKFRNEVRQELSSSSALSVRDPRYAKMKGLELRLDEQIARLEGLLGKKPAKLSKKEQALELKIDEIIQRRDGDRAFHVHQDKKIEALTQNLQEVSGKLSKLLHEEVQVRDEVSKITPLVEDRILQKIIEVEVLLAQLNNVNENGVVAEEGKAPRRGFVAGGIRKGYKKLEELVYGPDNGRERKKLEREVKKLKQEQKKLVQAVQSCNVSDVEKKNNLADKAGNLQIKIDLKKRKIKELGGKSVGNAILKNFSLPYSGQVNNAEQNYSLFDNNINSIGSNIDKKTN